MSIRLRYALEPDGFRSRLAEDRCESCSAALRELEAAYGNNALKRHLREPTE